MAPPVQYSAQHGALAPFSLGYENRYENPTRVHKPRTPLHQLNLPRSTNEKTKKTSTTFAVLAGVLGGLVLLAQQVCGLLALVVCSLYSWIAVWKEKEAHDCFV
jgi:hypothetical protein